MESLGYVMSTIDLLVPGLFDRLSDWQEGYQHRPSGASLERLLSQASRGKTEHFSLEAQLWALFIADSNAQVLLDSIEDPAYGFLGQSDASAAFMCRADPVHLYTDVTALYLRETSMADLSLEHRQELMALINDLFNEEGILFTLNAAGAGYLKFNAKKTLTANPPSQCLGESVFECLPKGADTQESAFWNRLQTEIQMLLFSAPFNEQRAAEGKDIINSLWLWGGGCETQELIANYQTIVADDNVTLELARFTDTEAIQWGNIDRLLLPDGGCSLMVENQFQKAAAHDDYEAWLSALERLEKELFTPLLEALQKGNLRRLRIFDGRGRCYTLSPSSLRKFWRRSRSLTSLAKASGKPSHD